MALPVFSHTLDKVRYFRNILLSSDQSVRIILVRDRVGTMEALRHAISDVSDAPANPLCVIQTCSHKPTLPVRGPLRPTPPILVYFRVTQDAFVAALLDEYGEENCEVVAFEKDPTLS